MPTEAEAIATLGNTLGAAVEAYSQPDGTWVCKPVTAANGESHAFMFHGARVSNPAEHAAHHAAGIDPTQFVPHVHTEA